MRQSPDDLPDDVIDATVQSLLKEGTVTSNAFGLLPFCKNNPTPAVSYQSSKILFNMLCLLVFMIPYLFPQADDNFWKVKYDHEAAKQARDAKKTERKTAKTGTSRKKKPSASELLKLDDTSSDDEEVIL